MGIGSRMVGKGMKQALTPLAVYPERQFEDDTISMSATTWSCAIEITGGVECRSSRRVKLRRDLKHRTEGCNAVPTGRPIEIPGRVKDQTTAGRGSWTVPEGMEHLLFPFTV